jgi:hypothetical protein
MPAPRRFPPPWSIEEASDACFIVRDNTGQALGYFYFEDEPGRRSAAKLLTRDEARRMAAMQLNVSDRGKLVGRVLVEALPNGAVPQVAGRVVKSEPAPNGLATVLNMQTVEDTRYVDAAGFSGRTVGLSSMPLSGVAH